MAERIRQFLKVDTDIDVIQVSHWKLEAVVADRFRVGRAFLVGDAAHRHTPGGGLGLNSAIQDAHNLCWKLTLALNGQASDALLDSYEAERRPVVARNAENSLLAFDNHMTFVSSMGIIPGAPPGLNQHNFAKLFADTADGRARRARVRKVFDAIVGLEYAPHDLEMGFQYDSAAIVQDGTPYPERDPLGSYYRPSTHPGCRLPHVWLHEKGKALSTHDLLPLNGFLLLAGNEGAPWVAAATRLAASHNLAVRALSVGAGREVSDPSGEWGRLADIGNEGVVLVRPDGHIAFRCAHSVNNADVLLAMTFDRILAKAGGRQSEAVA
jgi:2,4-dichlorophenol 6-monooxygenase